MCFTCPGSVRPRCFSAGAVAPHTEHANTRIWYRRGFLDFCGMFFRRVAQSLDVVVLAEKRVV